MHATAPSSWRYSRVPYRGETLESGPRLTVEWGTTAEHTEWGACAEHARLQLNDNDV
jgi:hypothetical protein